MESENQTTPPVTKENKSYGLLIVSLFFSIILAVFFVTKNKSTDQSMTKDQPSTPAIVTTIPAVSVTPDSPMNGQITIEAGSFYYKPNLITVKKGEKVKIILNSVTMMHDLNIDELGIKIPVTKTGNSASVEFTADKVGEFEYYCSVGQHRANGQVGKLIVTE